LIGVEGIKKSAEGSSKYAKLSPPTSNPMLILVTLVEPVKGVEGWRSSFLKTGEAL